MPAISEIYKRYLSWAVVNMAKEKIILGLDPGTNVMGYGLILVRKPKVDLLQFGVIHLSKYAGHELRLKKIFERVISLIQEENRASIRVAERNKKSHLAKVVTAGLQEFRAHRESSEIPGEEIEASKRALERAEAIVHAELKRGLGGLATIGSTAPFVGLFGTVVGILNAFVGISSSKATGLASVAGGIAEALVTTAIGLFVAIPAVMMFNYFTNKVEAFDVEMDNSSSELIDYFLKQSGRARVGSR